MPAPSKVCQSKFSRTIRATNLSCGVVVGQLRSFVNVGRIVLNSVSNLQFAGRNGTHQVWQIRVFPVQSHLDDTSSAFKLDIAGSEVERFRADSRGPN